MNDLVLCHLDLVPRNIIITHENVVGILDWETLAIYPPIFELARADLRDSKDSSFAR